MSTSEIKNHLHQLIDSFDDKSLSTANNMLNDLNEHKELFNEELPPAAIAGIEAGLRDIENGDFITLDEFLKNKSKWFTK
jgi:predicted transcriptional regulator